ncbi:MAG: hypothetical protein EPN55_03500 [Gammaproteobacteria bacterium]|nr:MAG: hypothetical protein EPN55_03500 [Gammaproteobacteria bacterium]
MNKPRLIHLPEPQLEFRFGQKVSYPRDGLYLFGPVDAAREPRQVRYGVIGTATSLRRFKEWAAQVSSFIDVPPPRRMSKAIQAHHVAFPGFNEAFFATWPKEPPRAITDIDEHQLLHSMHIANRHEAIKTVVDVFVDRLVADRKRDEDPPSFWYVVIPEFIYELGRPQSTVAAVDRVTGKITLKEKEVARLAIQPTLFGQAEEEAEVYKYARNFRRQLKARLLDHQIVTQIVRETTLTPHEFLKENRKDLKRRVEDPATIAWKLCTASYYKSGGRPWQLADVRPGVCYVGLVYKQQPMGSDIRHACCAAQMFLSDGEGVVFRGALGPWYQPDSKQFHLDRAAAQKLVSTVLAEYRLRHPADPVELFIHAKSSFSDEEWAGFVEACQGKGTNVVGVQISDAWDQLKLYRPGTYPTIRGTAMLTDRRSGFLWTSGYIPRLDTYMGPDTPNPLHVSVRRGDADIQVVMADVLSLSKINFNTCLFNDRSPVTIRFADAIGDILVSAPVQSEPRLPFKFYI